MRLSARARAARDLLRTELGKAQPGSAAGKRCVATQFAPVTVKSKHDNAVGRSDAASQGRVNAAPIQSRPTLRPTEVPEFVTVVIVTRHSGDGQAKQYFLRGFNIDQGSDFASVVGGMPVNMPTHAHGHGYSALNWLLPEPVNRIHCKEGPYRADEGDFASAGAAHIRLFDGGELLNPPRYNRPLSNVRETWPSGLRLQS